MSDRYFEEYKKKKIWLEKKKNLAFEQGDWDSWGIDKLEQEPNPDAILQNEVLAKKLMFPEDTWRLEVLENLSTLFLNSSRYEADRMVGLRIERLMDHSIQYYESYRETLVEKLGLTAIDIESHNGKTTYSSMNKLDSI